MITIERFTFQDKYLINQAFSIRNEVFVIEQAVDKEEEYEFEEESIHFILFENNKACATARYRETKNGIKLERFAVLKEDRGKGYGMQILLKMLEDIQEINKTKYLHAQVQVVPFYEKVGFKKVGRIFEEAEIMHYKMIKQ
ncbi:MAG: GNAT family N-acetyltransferase [Bacteroidota bacterium]|nr:GNAT family N-acetyltransferase [Bacteroidota bacterium]